MKFNCVKNYFMSKIEMNRRQCYSWEAGVNNFAFIILQGAYTGVCSQQHVPSYKNSIDKFRAQKVDSVICVAVNDPYVLNAWAEKLQVKDAVSLP
jgi:peroxiredoxin